MRRPDYDLTSLRLFIAVCDHGNIARVAEQEHMVNSAVSKRMAQLEQQAGSALLERRRYGVRPTAAGETVLAYAQEMLSIARRLEDAMHGYSSGVRGQVRVLANASVMAEALADDVVAFMQMPQYANIRIDIEERLSPAVISGVREGSASVGIVWSRVDLHELQSRPYRCDHLGVVVHREHPLAQAKTQAVAFADTLEWEHVGLPGTSSIQRLFEQTALAHGKRLRGKVVVSSYESAMRVVSAQLAICVVPMELFGEAAAYQKLVHIPLTDDWAVRQFVLCYRDEAALSPSALAFVRHLAAD
ncbi:LysR family transcriptional regulator [Lampropedia aestuarii]|uniref:LysR family transcriptional regulator n=1 Tax=Lampropedia aestuarii TaxID=2562762 RepID=A0A4S5BIS0_9BURK|nr:LysR family transcriptional regulator [Lampropedia aestuarii]THJ30695.1 LysR family transcriptional regulator [Lampropedia aestuarii]